MMSFYVYCNCVNNGMHVYYQEIDNVASQLPWVKYFW